MLLNCRISAPGKVILHGEHSVVFGKDALVSSIGLRTQLYLLEKENTSCISVEFPNLQFKIETTLDDVNIFLESSKNTPELIRSFIMQRFKRSNEIENNTLVAFFFVLSKAFGQQKVKTAFNISLTSDLTIGAGSGSSAAFGVCIATAFLLLARKITDPYFEHLDLISNLAFESEKIMHLSPSGVDNTICTYGGILKFAKGQGFSKISIPKQNKLNVLLVDSGVSRNTANLVAHVKDQHDKFPKLFESIFNSMQIIVEEAILKYSNENHFDFKAIENLFDVNSGLLRAIGVSHPSLELIFRIASKNGFSSKLTGAGGGGFAIILLPEDFRNLENYRTMILELNSSNFKIVETDIGGSGMLIENE